MRGINNPGNIRISPTKWHGKIVPSNDKEFEQFDTPINGIRAIAIILINYHKNYDLHSINEIITRWAPPSENDTKSYIKDVSSRTGILPDEVIDFANAYELANIVKAIIHHELGTQPYDAATIDAGVQSALSRGI